MRIKNTRIVLMIKSIASLLLFSCISSMSAAEQFSESDINSWLIQTANVTNKQLPLTSTGMGIRWDLTTAGPGRKFTYQYTYLNQSSNQINKAMWQAKIDSEVVKNCQVQDIAQFMRYGVIVTYAYYGNDGGFVGSSDLTPTKCGY